MHFRFFGCVAALFANINLGPPLLVLIVVLNAVDLHTMTLKRAPLGKRFLAQVTFIRTNTCVCPRMSLQIKCVVESLSAEGAQVSLCIAVTFHVSVQESLETEGLCADPAGKSGGVSFTP